MSQAEEDNDSFLRRWTASVRVLQHDATQSHKGGKDNVLGELEALLHLLLEQLSVKSALLPPYELKRCSLEIQKAQHEIQDWKLKHAPRPRFAFKATNARLVPIGSPANLSEVNHETPTAAPIVSLSSDNGAPTTSLALKSRSNCFLSQADLSPSSAASNEQDSLLLSGLDRCFIDLERPSFEEGVIPKGNVSKELSAIYMYHLKDCVVFLNSVASGSVMIHDCSGCIIVVIAHQFRMHSSSRCLVALEIPSTPIIEGCRNIKFASYPQFLYRKIDSMDNAEERIGLSTKPSAFDQVRDFDDPFAVGTSDAKNWSIAPNLSLPWNIVSEQQSEDDVTNWWKNSAQREKHWERLLAEGMRSLQSYTA